MSSVYDPPVSYPPTIVDDFVYSQAPSLWHLPPSVWNPIWEKEDTSNLIAAILDTGYAKHIDGPEPIASKSFISGQSVFDGNGHGTHCIGTVLGSNGIGVAPKTKLVVGKVLSNSGSGSSSGIAAGIRWAVDQGAHVISLSLGGGPYQPTLDAVDYAFSKGCWVNAAAGNAGYGGNDTVGYPAKYKSCLSCGAFQQNGTIANFSSGGKVDWACPGQAIISFSRNGSGYQGMSGTSMATPFGAGILIHIYNRCLRYGYSIYTVADQLREFFKKNMKDSGAPGWDVRFGAGIPVINDLLHIFNEGDFQYV